MSRRYVSIWLPTWPIDRWRLAANRRGEPTHGGAPFALLHPAAGGPRLYALSPEAAIAKLRAGLGLADARAICPSLVLADAAPARDREALEALTLWCGRYTPWTAVDGDDGVILDVTGCAHLFGGETALVADVVQRLAAFGFAARVAAASNPHAAWAWARFGAGGVLPAKLQAAALLALPVAALRLPEPMVAGLARLGFRTIADLERVPAAPVMARFGALPIERLHLVRGRTRQPFTGFAAPARYAVRFAWAEPLATTEGLEAALTEALTRLCGQLEQAEEGVRRLVLELARLDGAVHRLERRTSLASRDAAALARLFQEDLAALDVGFGIECLRLAATETERLRARQVDLPGNGGGGSEAEALARLVDRLSVRLGPARVQRLQPQDSHRPERAQLLVPAVEGAAGATAWPERGPRPLRLLDEPLRLTAIAELPDGPPLRLCLGPAVLPVAAAAGPERIAPEWWRCPDAPSHDYYRLDLEDGRRWWVRREGTYGDTPPPSWSLAGVFA
ncbi:MAG: DNA polymerase Y family protein [Geminicoccaceae bacterium]|nr:MAG: DNA polymerase Y family protein [Geminicoccaceae bacterium]